MSQVAHDAEGNDSHIEGTDSIESCDEDGVSEDVVPEPISTGQVNVAAIANTEIKQNMAGGRMPAFAQSVQFKVSKQL